MGEAIVTEISKEIIKKIGSTAWKQIKLAKDLPSHMDELRDLKSSIEALLRGRDPFEVSSGYEGRLLQKQRGVKDKLDYLIDELEARVIQKEVLGGSRFTTEVHSFFSLSNQLVSPFRSARKVSAVIKEVQGMNNNFALALVSSGESSAVNRNPGISLDACPLITEEVIGRDEDRDNIIPQLLCDSNDGPDSVSVAAIVGIGGQGKTTLARYVYHDERVKACFDVQLWVSSTPQSSLSKIVEKIIEYATTEKPFECGEAKLYPQFLHAMSAFVGKKCLLVLDNIWYQDSLVADWDRLKMSIGVRGRLGACRIAVLITTRNPEVAKMMKAAEPYMLDGLNESDSLVLLQRFARKHGQIPGVEAIEKEIIDLCPKVPLVVKHIGCQLAQRHTIRELQEFKNKLASKSAFEVDDKALQTLKVSYDQLDDKLKLCVAYCSLFPRGNRFNTDEMVLFWTALGFVESRNDERLEDAGVECVHKLICHGFFEHQHRYFKQFRDKMVPSSDFSLHDVMHDFITLIGKSKHQMIDSKTKEITEGVCHVSLDTEEDPNWDVLFSKFKGEQPLQSILKVCFNRWNTGGRSLGSRIEKWISRFPHLKVLVLYGERIEKVPRSIGELIHLRHLDLSENPFRKLPNSITKLVHLLSLKLVKCRNLQELPRDMGKLVKLRHLWVEETKLRRMPKGFGNLRELRTLDMFVVEGDLKCSVGAQLEELGHLNNLEGWLTIRVSGQSKHIGSEALMENKTKLCGLDMVFEKRGKEDEKFLEDLQLSDKNLEWLTIRNYGGKKLPTWMTDDRFHERFPKLVHMYLQCCESKEPLVLGGLEDVETFEMRVENNEEDLLEWAPGYSRLKEQLKTGPMELHFKMPRGNGLLKSLRDLPLQSLRIKIEKQLAPRSGGGGGGQGVLLKSCFPNLVALDLWDIPELEVLPEELRDLSALEGLRIERCPKLKEIPHWIDSFSSLQNLIIKEAPQLTALPASIGDLTSLCRLYLRDCPRLESLPHQISKLSQCGFKIEDCSKALFEKCRKPTGEYWPFIQHLPFLHIKSTEGDEFECWDWETWWKIIYFRLGLLSFYGEFEKIKLTKLFVGVDNPLKIDK